MTPIVSLALSASLLATASTAAVHSDPIAPAVTVTVDTAAAPTAGRAPDVVVAAPTVNTPDDARIAGVLEGRSVSLSIRNATVLTVVDALEEALGIPILVFVDGALGNFGGLDPELRVDAEIERGSAAQAIATVADIFGEGDATWQIASGRVEIGSHAFLGRPSVRRLVALRVNDETFVAPGHPMFRDTQEVGAANLIASIETTVEPMAWVPEGALLEHRERNEEIRNPLSRVGRYASMTYRDGTLVITAPPFMLRQIVGLGTTTASTDDQLPRIITRFSAVDAAGGPDDRTSVLGGLPLVTLREFVPSSGASRRPNRTVRDSLAAESLGRLMHARVDVLVEGDRVDDAIDALLKATGTSARVWWSSEKGDREGIDPASRIRLRLRNASGLDVLQTMLDMADPRAEPTWQVVGTLLEAGPRAVLARSSARRTEVYPIDDLLLELPYFVPPRKFGYREVVRDVTTPLEDRHGEKLGIFRDRQGNRRKSAAYVNAEFLIMLAAQIEPPAWVPPWEDSPIQYTTNQPLDDPLRLVGTWATASPRDGKLVVRAPDFIHRQIIGPPSPPSPADAER